MYTIYSLPVLWMDLDLWQRPFLATGVHCWFRDMLCEIEGVNLFSYVLSMWVILVFSMEVEITNYDQLTS